MKRKLTTCIGRGLATCMKKKAMLGEGVGGD
jgi:hypothetical protein